MSRAFFRPWKNRIYTSDYPASEGMKFVCTVNVYASSTVDSQMKTFYLLITFIVVFHAHMLRQLHLSVNSINGKHEKIPSKTFQPI